MPPKVSVYVLCNVAISRPPHNSIHVLLVLFIYLLYFAIVGELLSISQRKLKHKPIAK